MRDYTDLIHLVILSNLENTNSELIRKGIIQKERLVQLNESAIFQMKSLKDNQNIAKLEEL